MEDIVFPQPADGSDRRVCPKCGDNTLYLRISGTMGGFVACLNYVNSTDGTGCSYRRRLLPGEGEIDAPGEGQALGVHPETGAEVELKQGPYGWCALCGARSWLRLSAALPRLPGTFWLLEQRC
jgi:DNA topoisomerase I